MRLSGGDPRWDLKVQIMPEADAEKTPHADYPLIVLGAMEPNRNLENYLAEIQQAAFSHSNIVPGIEFSPDKVLQARIFAYADAHRY